MAPEDFSVGGQSLVFASFQHMHTLGRHIWTMHAVKEPSPSQHWVEKHRIGSRDEVYDFNRQEVKMLDEPFTIAPGHGFVTHCQYDTRSRTSRVQFGDETEDEMCFDFLLVTPAITKRTCFVPLPNDDGFGEFELP